MREVVVDIETTGLDHKKGDKIIEIACLELINHIPTDNYYHAYINPDGKEISEGAFKVHGISEAFLSDKPLFSEIADDFLGFIGDSQILAHNASFDVGFLNNELSIEKKMTITDDKIIDTLVIARKKHPGMPNNLDALCRRYNISEQKRGLHDAKSDCELLAQVYIELIGGRQSNLDLNKLDEGNSFQTEKIQPKLREKRNLNLLSESELQKHNEFISKFISDAMWNKKEEN
ncbi:MAG: DNA polymerase III subunit epsilon [Hyphomicrobiales bacterium]